MTNRTLLILFFVIPVTVFATTVLASVGVGEITHRFTGAPDCLVLDPEAGTVLIKENVEPNDEFTIRQFITNRCDNTITVEIQLDAPNVGFIDIDSGDVGIFEIVSEATISATATVSFANDTPADFSAKDVVFEITRPE